jgi:hypothetical protein
LRSLTIKGQGDGAAGPPLLVPLSGQRLALTGGSSLILSATAPDSLGMRIALPPGTRIKNLQLEGKDQLVLDLLPPRQRAIGQGVPPGAAAELTITPPITEASPGKAVHPPNSSISTRLPKSAAVRALLNDTKL